MRPLPRPTATMALSNLVCARSPSLFTLRQQRPSLSSPPVVGRSSPSQAAVYGSHPVLPPSSFPTSPSASTSRLDILSSSRTSIAELANGSSFPAPTASLSVVEATDGARNAAASPQRPWDGRRWLGVVCVSPTCSACCRGGCSLKWLAKQKFRLVARDHAGCFVTGKMPEP
nr:uncharacterized protein LOC120962073 isoform X2 [Aegilops tauschii subsp. strangulata]